MLRKAQMLSLIALAAWLFGSTGLAQTPAGKLEITAFAVNMSNISTNLPTGGATTVKIVINSWTPAAERQRLGTALVAIADDGYGETIQHTKVCVPLVENSHVSLRPLSVRSRISDQTAWFWPVGQP